MIQIFRRNWFVFTLLLFPYSLLTRAWIFFGDPVWSLSTADQSQAYSYLEKFFPANPLGNVILACVVVFFNAALINHIVIKNRIAREINLFPGMVYVVLTALHKDMFWLSPYLIGQFFLLVGVANIFRVYQKPFAGSYIFNAGLFTGLGAVIYIPYTVFILFCIIAILILRKFSIRDLLQLLLGFLIVFFFKAFLLYWHDAYPNPFTEYSSAFLWKLGFINYKINEWIIFVVMAGISLIGITNYRKFTIKKSIQSQKKVDLNYWFLIFGILTLPFTTTSTLFPALIILFFPLSVFIAMLMTRSKNEAAMEILHVFILFFILFSHFWF